MQVKMLLLCLLVLQWPVGAQLSGHRVHYSVNRPKQGSLPDASAVRLLPPRQGALPGMRPSLMTSGTSSELSRHSFVSSAVQQEIAPPAEEAMEDDSSSKAELPPDAILVNVREKPVWDDERLEYNGLRSDPRTPSALRVYLQSFQDDKDPEKFYHAFDGKGQLLSDFKWATAGLDNKELSDTMRLRMITDLLDAVNFLHSRGSSHLGLDAASIRVIPCEQKVRQPELRILGLGAGVSLGSSVDRDTYVMANSVDFHAPETLSSAVFKYKLKDLFMLDSWAVGVLVAMIAGSMSESPYQANADILKGIFTDEQATIQKIDEIDSQMSKFLVQIDSGSGGFLFRHGWVIKVILGLLQKDPKERLDISDAWKIAKDASTIDDKSSLYAMAATEARGVPVMKQPPATLAAAAAAAVEAGNQSEPFRNLEAMLNIIDRGQAFMLVQKIKYKNYGELVGFRNRVSRQRWDVFAPGIKDQLAEGEVFRVRRVLGVVLVKNGNHKLAIQLDDRNSTQVPRTNYKFVNSDVQNFIGDYVLRHKGTAQRVKYMKLADVEVKKRNTSQPRPLKMVPAVQEPGETVLLSAPVTLAPEYTGSMAIIGIFIGLGIMFAMRRLRSNTLKAGEALLLAQ